MKKRVLLIFVLLAISLTTSAVAVAPMGPPTAGLKTGQFRAGFDYSISETDIKAEFEPGDMILKDVQSNLFAANLGYGICDDWEVFTRLGVANAEFDKTEVGGVTMDWDPGFNGDYGFLYGLGIKVTFLKQEKLNWGALFQIHWLNSKDTIKETIGVDTDEVEFQVDMFEIHVAAGPTWQVAEGLSIYGGPFFYFIGGDFDVDSKEFTSGVLTDRTKTSGDLKEESSFGGYVGAQWDLAQSTSWYGEFQFTGDSWVFGTGIGFKF